MALDPVAPAISTAEAEWICPMHPAIIKVKGEAGEGTRFGITFRLIRGHLFYCHLIDNPIFADVPSTAAVKLYFIVT